MISPKDLKWLAQKSYETKSIHCKTKQTISNAEKEAEHCLAKKCKLVERNRAYGVNRPKTQNMEKMIRSKLCVTPLRLHVARAKCKAFSCVLAATHSFPSARLKESGVCLFGARDWRERERRQNENPTRLQKVFESCQKAMRNLRPF